jgi:hypothetical protein
MERKHSDHVSPQNVRFLILAYFGLFWPILAYFGLFWPIFTKIGLREIWLFLLSYSTGIDFPVVITLFTEGVTH